MKREFRRTSIITAGCFAVLGGIGFARLYDFTNLAFILGAGFLIILAAKKPRLSLFIIAIAFGFMLGWWRGSISYSELNYLRSFSGQEVTVEGIAKTDSIYGDKSQVEFELERVSLVNPDNSQLPGVFKISGYGEPMIYRGDLVEVTGKLFPTRGSKQAVIAYADLARLGDAKSWDESLRQNFVAGMYNALPEPQASFGLGLLIGQRSTLPTATLLALSAVGLTHIIAVSGYNLTILVRAVNRTKIFGSRFQQLMASLLLIGVFILITGFSASIVRAGLIAGLGLWAWYYGRTLRPILAIAFTACLTGLINPFYVWSDVGWYLSFLAFFGVLITAPALVKRFYKNKKPKWFMLVLIETLCAYVMTLPLIMYIFGQVSVVALVANLLVIPLIPLAMFFSVIAGIAGTIIPQFSAYIALPAKILLSYILDVADALASLSFAQVSAKLSTPQMLVMYGLVIALVVILILKNDRIGRLRS